MVRTNTANSGTTYIDMDIQVLGEDNAGITLRAVIYLTSRSVSDSTNSCDVTGQWSRGGALTISGVYGQPENTGRPVGTPVWSQDVYFGKVVGVPQQVGWNLSWSGINYWGVTLSGTALYTIAAAVGAPSAPSGYSSRNHTTTTAYTTNVSVASNGGAAVNNLQVNWARPGGAELKNRVMGAWTDGYMDGMQPGSYYDFQVAAANGYYWSAWGPWIRLATLPIAPAAPTISDITQTTAMATMVPTGTAIDQVVYRVYNASGTPVIDYFSPIGTVPTSYLLTGLTPGETYTIGVFQHSATPSYSPESARTTFTMAPAVVSGLYLNVDGENKNAELWMNVMGTWKVIELHNNVLGDWKRIT